MKGIVLGLVFMVLTFGSQAYANDECCNPTKVTTFKCMSTCDVLKGVGCYLKDATQRSVKGAGMILSAPLKAKFCFPEPEIWRYTSPKFRFTPPKWEKMDKAVPMPELRMPDIDIGEPKELIQPLHYDSPAMPKNFATIFTYKF